MAAIWLSLTLLGIGTLITIAVIAAKSAINTSGVEISDDTVLVFDLSSDIVDRKMPRKILDEVYGNNDSGISLDDVVNAIDRAAEDDKVVAIYLKCFGGEAGLAQYHEIYSALERFKTAGKQIYAYSDSYSQGNYYLASLASRIILNPSGSVDLHGLQATTLFFKDLLDNIGVEAQVVKVGTYKSAVEPFILDSMSSASRHQQEVFLGNMWKFMASDIARNRALSFEQITAAADSLPVFLQAETLKSMGLVDTLLYERQIDSAISYMTGSVAKRDKKKASSDKPRYVDLLDYGATFDASEVDGGGDKNIAILYATGDITDTEDDGIVGDKMVNVITELAEDDDIDGLILRVNSGGGSAYASEQIWEALKYFKEQTGKPFYVSMGDYAASGGYYISCGADRIFADNLTLTGSIGIFGILPSAEKLMKQKIGVNTATVATNPKGLLPTIFQTMTPRQRRALQASVDNGYELFTRRVAEGRNMPVDSVKKIAEGRVWDGQTALSIGLVDELGDLRDALAAMSKELGVTGYKVSVYPSLEFKWWESLLDLDSQMSSRMIISDIPGALTLYNSIESLNNLSVLQCRMDYIIVK